MMRKQARERREYLFRKGQESQERIVHERKRRFREAVEGKLYFALIVYFSHLSQRDRVSLPFACLFFFRGFFVLAIP